MAVCVVVVGIGMVLLVMSSTDMDTYRNTAKRTRTRMLKIKTTWM